MPPLFWRATLTVVFIWARNTLWQAAKIKDLPCWCFHGDEDDAVPVERSREMLRALWAGGGHPNYTEYPGVGHNSWDKAYATDELYQWLLQQKLK